MVPIQITVKDISSSPAIKSHIQERASKLKRFYDRINTCHVVVELPQKHKHKGKLFNVRVDLKVPGSELVVTRKKNEDVYVAIRDAFDALERQLEDHARKRHGRVKSHEPLIKGFIKRIFPKEGYGFIEGIDYIEYYFSDLNVSYPQFAQLAIGDQVAFLPQAKSNGHHAHRVIKNRD